MLYTMLQNCRTLLTLLRLEVGELKDFGIGGVSPGILMDDVSPVLDGLICLSPCKLEYYHLSVTF